MNPMLVISGIQATLRAAQAGAQLYGEHARDRKIFLPDLELPEGSRAAQLVVFLKDKPQLAQTSAAFADIWDAENRELRSTQSERVDAAYTIMLQHKAKQQLLDQGKEENEAKFEADMLASGRMVEQWREERQPPSAFVRMALTLTDIGLEFIQTDPALFGIGSRGEKMIVAFANSMSALLPDDVSAFGSKTNFADRVLGIFLRAGLGSLAGNANTVFEDDDIANLMEGVTRPIVDALPESITDQMRYRDLVDALAGPCAEAAFTLLAENTESYFGKDFADDNALGVITSALFKDIQRETHAGSIVDVFNKQGLIRIYQAGLRVALERPALFLGNDHFTQTDLFKELLNGFATTLHAHPRFEGPIGTSLAAMVVEVLGENASALFNFDPQKPWEKVADIALAQITAGLSTALETLDADGAPKGALKAFSHRQLLELVRIIFQQAAQTPGMLGIEESELQTILSGIMEAMAADDDLLLSPDEWIKIAGVAAEKAAANPGRLFGLSVSADDPGQALAVKVIRSVLKAAGEIWTQQGRAGQSVLFGKTLEKVLEASIEALAGNIAALVDQPGMVDGFLERLKDKSVAAPEKFGSDTMQDVFRGLIGNVLANGTLPTDGEIEAILFAKEA